MIPKKKESVDMLSPSRKRLIFVNSNYELMKELISGKILDEN